MISNKFNATLTLEGNELLINSMRINYSLNSMFPTTAISVGSNDYAWMAGEVASRTSFPVVGININVENIQYSYQGIVTSISGVETASGIGNTFTVMPMSYYGTLKVGTFDGTTNRSYLTNARQLANDIIDYFNASIFTSIPDVIRPVRLEHVIVPSTYNDLLIAPRFIGISLSAMLEQIYGVFGYSILFTWDDQIIIGSLNNPITSGQRITKDMTNGNSFRDDVALNLANIQLGW